MKQIKYIFALLVALALFSSCETTIEYDLPQEPSKITIDTKLLVGDTPVVHVFTSVSALSHKSPEAAVNAEVLLFENGVQVSTLQLQSNVIGQTFYSSQYRILPNQLYRVQASLPSYPTAYGEGITKEAVPIISTVFDSTTQNLVFTFQDPPTSGDYYLITLRSLTESYPMYYSTNDVVIDFFDGSSFDDPFSGSEEKYGELGYMSDQYFNGKTKSVRLTILDENIQPDQTPRFVEVYRISEDLYEHERTRAIAWISENPFSEPVQVYSNIENGYGIVGAAAVSRKQFYP